MATNSIQLPFNKWSTILTESENQVIFDLLEPSCKTLSTTLVRLLLSEEPDHRYWRISFIGVGCLVKDLVSGTLFIRIIDFVDKTILWEHRMTETVDYKCPNTLLIAFETFDCIVGINFSIEEEAVHFRDTLIGELSKAKPLVNETPKSQSQLLRKSVSKEQINTPTNFRHSLRIVLNPLIGFEVTKPNDKESDHKMSNLSDNSSAELFESEDEIKVEEAFQFLNQRDDSIDSNGSDFNFNVESIMNSRPVPKARMRSLSTQRVSVMTQTDQAQTLHSVLVNKFFEPVTQVPPPPIIKAMKYLSSRSELAQI